MNLALKRLWQLILNIDVFISMFNIYLLEYGLGIVKEWKSNYPLTILFLGTKNQQKISDNIKLNNDANQAFLKFL